MGHAQGSYNAHFINKADMMKLVKSCRLELEWARGRLFDAHVAEVFRRIVAEAGSARVVSVSVKEERRQRPNGTGL
jgi:hypothetical protein